MSTEEEFNLNLSGADTTAGDYDAIPAATYKVEVAKAEITHTKGGPNAKMPEGTPMINLGYRVTEGEYENRWIFRSYIIAPDGYDVDKKAKMDGQLVKMFTSLGYDEAEVMGGSFNPDMDDLMDREAKALVGRRQKKDSEGAKLEGEYENYIKATKPITAEDAEESANQLV